MPKTRCPKTSAAAWLARAAFFMLCGSAMAQTASPPAGLAPGAESRSSTAAADRLWLARGGRPGAAIVCGREDDYAAERLQRHLADTCGAKPAIVYVDRWQPAGADAVILVGSARSNPLIGRLGAQFGLKLDREELTDQGYVAKRLRHEGRDWLLLAGGGRDGALYAVTDLLNWELRHDGGDAWLESLETRQVPRFRYRWLWTWDNRMDWGGPGALFPRAGVGTQSGTYKKSPEAFLIDYKRCVDYMADHKFNGLIIWGFLRDCHGGVEAGQELCRYASRRGVRILPGVGTSGYGGYYYEGKHSWNTATWLAEHPDLRAIDKGGKPRPAPCPSKKANQDWLDRGAEWLFSTFQIGGVNLEMGDFFVCYCGDCQVARQRVGSDEPDHYKDMAISHMVTLKTMRRLAPEAWLSYATYTPFTAAMMLAPPKFLSMIPDDAICQWTLTRMAYAWPQDVEPMARHNLGYLHWCNASTRTADQFYLMEILNVCRHAAQSGFEGLDTYGELSPERINAEVFYLAWEAFLWQPEMTLEEFAERRLARVYGGRQAARTLLEIIPLVRTPRQRESSQNVKQALKLAETARVAASAEARPHWDRLIASLAPRP